MRTRTVARRDFEGIEPARIEPVDTPEPDLDVAVSLSVEEAGSDRDRVLAEARLQSSKTIARADRAARLSADKAERDAARAAAVAAREAAKKPLPKSKIVESAERKRALKAAEFMEQLKARAKTHEAASRAYFRSERAKLRKRTGW